MNSKRFKRKKIRLEDKRIYSIPGILAHVIIGTYNKVPYFLDKNLATELQKLLDELKNGKKFKIWAYCIMPDHVHLLLEAGEKGIIEAVRLIKGRFFRISQNLGKHFKWQRSFYDHILRKEESIQVVAHYIWENPIKEGLAENWKEYPYLGGLYKPEE